MTKRDADKLDQLIVMLTAHFSDPARQSVTIFRGDARAIVAAIRERNKRMARDAALREIG